MALSLADIGIGAAPDDDSGDPARTAGQTINANNALIEAADAENIKRDGSVDMTGVFGTDVGTFRSDVADGASNVAFDFNTTNAFTTAGGLLWRLRSNGSQKTAIDHDGTLLVPGNAGGNGESSRNNSGIRFQTTTGSQGSHDVGIGGHSSGRILTFWAGNNAANALWFDGTNILYLPGSKTALNIKGGSNLGAEIIIGGRIFNSDVAPDRLQLIGNGAQTTATTNLVGGAIEIIGGQGASSSSGNAHGGNVTIRGGQQYGTGSVGNVIMDTLPTADPTVAGALWNNSGVLTVSAG